MPVKCLFLLVGVLAAIFLQLYVCCHDCLEIELNAVLQNVRNMPGSSCFEFS